MKKRVLIFGESLTNAHMLRPWALALDLIKNGHEVYFATQKPFFSLGLVVPPLIKIIELPTIIESGYFINEVSKGRFPFSKDVLKTGVDQDLMLIKKIIPDLIISDFRLSLPISNRYLKIPQITLTNLHWSQYAKIERPMPRGHIFAKIVGGNIGDTFFKMFGAYILKQSAKPFNQLLKDRKMPLFKNLLEIFTFGSNVFYCDPPGFISTKNLPNNHMEIGPICHTFSNLSTVDLDSIPRNRKWIFIALGSSGPENILMKIIRTLNNLDNPIIIATSEKLNQKMLPSNVWIYRYVSGEDVLKNSGLFINNGGSAASYLALSHGVPSLSFPINIDQTMTSRVFKNRGVGDFFYHFNLEKLSKKVHYLLNDVDVESRCRKMRLQIEQHPYTDKMWNIINDVQSKCKIT